MILFGFLYFFVAPHKGFNIDIVLIIIGVKL